MAQSLRFTKRKKTRLVPCLINLLLRKNIRSQPGHRQHQRQLPSLCRLPEPWQRKLGTKRCSLATAAVLQSGSSRLFYTAKKGTSNTDSTPRHITPATSSQPNQHPGSIQDADLVYHQPDGQTSPAVPDDVALPTGFLQLSTCAENRRQHPTQKDLDCKPSMWLNPFAQPDAPPPFRHTSRRLTSLRREQTIAVMHQLHSCHLPNRRHTVDSLHPAPQPNQHPHTRPHPGACHTPLSKARSG